MSTSSKLNRARRAAVAARDNIARIADWAADKTLADLQSKTLLRYGVERAFMAIDAALRDIPAEVAARHQIPARFIADFRNILAHTYEEVLDARIITTIRDDLPQLDRQLVAIIAELDTQP